MSDPPPSDPSDPSASSPDQAPAGEAPPGPVGSCSAGIGAVVGLAALCIVFVLWKHHRDGSLPPPASYRYDLGEYARIDPSLIRYRPVLRIDTAPETPSAVAADASGRIWISAGSELMVHAAGGKRLARHAASGPARALAIGPDGTVYLAREDHVERVSPDGSPLRSWPPPSEKALLTSLAAAAGRVYAADAASRLVWILGPRGEVLGSIGARDDEKNAPGIILPSPWFDVALAPDGLLRVANPGRHRIEAYTEDGHMELSWGEASFKIEGFSGCCNPAHFALLPRGGFVTSEKGLARVKVHDEDGAFAGVVAGPRELGEDGSARDVAVDPAGRVIVADPATRSVRVFTRTKGENRSSEHPDEEAGR